MFTPLETKEQAVRRKRFLTGFTSRKRVFIIAEAGVNHNGSLKLAKKMIDLARDAGADAVKFQIFKAENIVTKNARKADYQIANTRAAGSQYEMLKKLELKKEEFMQLADYAKKRKIVFLASVFDKEGVDLLNALGVSAFKIPSGEITNLPLIKYISEKHKPIILSTGMADFNEIREAISLIKTAGTPDINLLHCITDYPARVRDVNLKVMQELRKTFRLPVGFSDHTPGILVSLAAVALGARIIEKHFTLNNKMFGPDQRSSLEPDELKSMIKAIRDVETALGNGVKKLTLNEKKIKRLVRRSIVAKVDIPKGARIRESMLELKRPGTGIAPKFLNCLIGKKTKHSIARDSLLNYRDFQ